MRLGYIGLGKMGKNMVLRLLEKKHKPVVYDVNPAVAKSLKRSGADPAGSIEELVDKMSRSKKVYPYRRGSMGPKEADKLLEKDGFKWLKPELSCPIRHE